MDNGGNWGIAQISSMKKKRGETYSQGAFSVSVHRCTNTLCQSILMHYPVGLHKFGCPAFVKHQRFLHPNLANSPHRSVDGFVGPRSLLVAGDSLSWMEPTTLQTYSAHASLPKYLSYFNFHLSKDDADSRMMHDHAHPTGKRRHLKVDVLRIQKGISILVSCVNLLQSISRLSQIALNFSQLSPCANDQPLSNEMCVPELCLLWVQIRVTKHHTDSAHECLVHRAEIHDYVLSKAMQTEIKVDHHVYDSIVSHIHYSSLPRTSKTSWFGADGRQWVSAPCSF